MVEVWSTNLSKSTLGCIPVEFKFGLRFRVGCTLSLLIEFVSIRSWVLLYARWLVVETVVESRSASADDLCQISKSTKSYFYYL